MLLEWSESFCCCYVSLCCCHQGLVSLPSVPAKFDLHLNLLWKTEIGSFHHPLFRAPWLNPKNRVIFNELNDCLDYWLGKIGQKLSNVTVNYRFQEKTQKSDLKTSGEQYICKIRSHNIKWSILFYKLFLIKFQTAKEVRTLTMLLYGVCQKVCHNKNCYFVTMYHEIAGPP